MRKNRSQTKTQTDNVSVPAAPASEELARLSADVIEAFQQVNASLTHRQQKLHSGSQALQQVQTALIEERNAFANNQADELRRETAALSSPPRLATTS